MTEPETPPADTATLLAAGLAGERSTGRWQPPALEDLQGVFPNIVVMALLGAGGMGAVYLARQPHLDRKVALKLLNPARASDPQFDERFTREARALARLDHPHVVRIHDFGRIGARPYLVMEFIEGSNLRQVMATGTLSSVETLRLVGQLCDALAHAHAAGVVHRDLKPENILIDGRGDAHIADFGLAKITEGDQALTATGEVLGTLHYMAPEQLAAAASVDHRADLYALGVITYEMLTGALPLGRFEPPSRRGAVGAAVDPVVLRSLEADPRRRYGSAVDMRDALAKAGTSRAAAAAQPAGVQTDPEPATAPAEGTWATEAPSAPHPVPSAPIPPTPPTPPSAPRPPGPPPAPAAASGTAAEPEARIPEVEKPQGPKDHVSVSWKGIHVQDGEDEVHVGFDGIRVKGKGQAHAPPPAARSGLRAVFQGGGEGSGTLYKAGMVAIFLGSALSIGFGSGRLLDFLQAPSAHLEAHRFGDLAMLATPAYIVSGIALLSRCCLPMVILGGVAELMFVPWLWQDHRALFWLLIGPLIWQFQAIFHFHSLRDHMASLPWHGRLLRMLWMVPLICLALVAPLLPWMHHGLVPLPGRY